MATKKQTNKKEGLKATITSGENIFEIDNKNVFNCWIEENFKKIKPAEKEFDFILLKPDAENEEKVDVTFQMASFFPTGTDLRKKIEEQKWFFNFHSNTINKNIIKVVMLMQDETMNYYSFIELDSN